MSSQSNIGRIFSTSRNRLLNYGNAAPLVILLLYCILNQMESLLKLSQRVGISPRAKGYPEIRMSDSTDVFDVSNRFKIVPYGATSANPQFTLECKDPKYRIVNAKSTLSRRGGLGLQLIEIDKLPGRGRNGLVLVEGVKDNGNAAKPLSGNPIMIGDALTFIEGLNDKGTAEKTKSLEGLDFDATLDCLGQFEEYDVVNIGYKRIVERKVVTIDVCGPDGKSFTKLQVLSGYSMDLRTLLQANNIKVYDERTARFDSPYQTGNCGGDGTCGTCLVDIVSGSKYLNTRVRVEDAVLKKQDCPKSFRWACRTFIGKNPEDEGEVKIRLRPQSNLFK